MGGNLRRAPCVLFWLHFHRVKSECFSIINFGAILRIHKWRTRGKKLVPSHESEALEDKQKLQMKTFSELAECLARIPPKITLYGLLFKYSYVGCLLLLMFSNDLLFAIKRDAYIFKEIGWFCRYPKRQKLESRNRYKSLPRTGISEAWGRCV